MKNIQSVLTLYKNRGETPLECLERFKKDNPEYKDEKMTYAGRLDPLAEGVLLVLVGDECKNKEKYLGLDKEYEVDVLFGFATDTYDILGKVTLVSDENCVIPAEAGIQANSIQPGLPRFARNDTMNKLLNSFIGRFSQKYPKYASKNIKSILKARSGDSFLCEQSEAIQDNKEVEIKSIEFLGERTISKNDLEKYIIDSVNLVKGDFRQKEILDIWKNTLAVIPAKAGIQANSINLDSCLRRNDNTSQGLIRENGRMMNNNEFQIISIRVNCTSGTYMRSLANSIGEKVGIPALALNINRTKIGSSF